MVHHVRPPTPKPAPIRGLVKMDGWLAAQFIVALAMLGVGAYQDYKTHEVPNRVWLVFGSIGGFVSAARFGVTILLGVWLTLACILGIAGYVVWLVAPKTIGGADVKALMALGVIISPYAFLTLGGAIVVSEIYLFAKGAFDRLSWKQIKELKVPFVPFLLAGLCLTLFLSG